MSSAPRSVKISVALSIMYKNQYHRDTAPAANEVHVRHLTVDEALLKLDQYLDATFMEGLHQIRVVHGKGAGVLREVVRKWLHTHPLVKSYRPGEYGEGGAGVTIVQLAEK